ncbi:mucin TcMUCII [Trypanosoma cruzi cruzi]|nr:mucin TcMUCII [Trypanosoma cruzi cruzi]
MMMTCRLLCALLVLALCCCPSVCVTESSQVSVKDSPTHSLTPPQGTGLSGTTNTSTTSIPAVPAAVSPGKNESPNTQGTPGAGQALPENPSVVAAPAGSPGPESSVPIKNEVPGGSGISGSPGNPGPVADTVQKNGDNDTTESKSGNNPSTDQTNTNADDSGKKNTAATINTTTTTTTTTAPEHQVLRLQRRQPRRPPAHRHVFAKLTAPSAALRGCVPRCCLPHPRWRTPLWAEEVCAGCACQHSRGIVRPLWSDVNK